MLSYRHCPPLTKDKKENCQKIRNLVEVFHNRLSVLSLRGLVFLVFKQVIGTTLVLQLCTCDCSNDWELKLLMMERAFSRGL